MIQKGTPHEEGKVLSLGSDKILIGRTWQDNTPDISFDDPRISRKHAEITYEDERFILRDLMSSKYGVEVNGRPLIKGMPYVLRHNDKVSLARGTVALRFVYQSEEGKTADLADYLEKDSPIEQYEDTHEIITVDGDRREVLLDGQELQPRMTGHEFELILLLYQNQGKAVSHDDIIAWVWRDVPNQIAITRQDINTLAHRMRKSLGEYGRYIKSIPSYGYRLDQEIDL